LLQKDRLFVDVDGVSADLSTYAIELNIRDSRISPTAKGSDIRGWNTPDFIPGFSFDYLKSPDFWLNIPIYPGAALQMQRLAARFQLVYVTHCPHIEARRTWLYEHGFPTGPAYSLAPEDKITYVRATPFVAAIEDRAETIQELALYVPDVYCVTQPWNDDLFPGNVYRPDVDVNDYPTCAAGALEAIVDRILTRAEVTLDLAA
jgi:hypothetical protein